MLPTEPAKVSVTVKNNNLGSIGEFVWDDINENGIYDDSEPGINGVKVKLYNNNDQFLKETITSNDKNGKPGYYMFNNLEAGQYKVKFIPIDNYTLTKQNTTNQNGSKPDQSTGFTNTITLSTNQKNLQINAGLIKKSCNPPTIIANDICINVNDTFNPMKYVTAKDCKGLNITDNVQYISYVNTDIAGIYTVTYSVQDSRNQITIKTINVKVCNNNKCNYQAITDLIESVALEETGLAHIINAEGEKIQKAKDMNLSKEELLEINNSVKSMIDSISNLEFVLQMKLSVFEDKLCSSNCCDNEYLN